MNIISELTFLRRNTNKNEFKMKIAVTRARDMRREATRQSLLTSFQKNQAGSHSHLCSPFKMCGDVLALGVGRIVL